MWNVPTATFKSAHVRTLGTGAHDDIFAWAYSERAMRAW